MPAPLNPHRARLGRRLRDLRASAGFSGAAFARRLGWLQSRVSKIETGKQLPTQDDLDVWLKAAGAEQQTISEIEELLASARIEYATWREMSRRTRGGLADQQREYRGSEEAAQYIGEYQPSMIPGIVQTPEYARALLTLPGGPLSSGASMAEVESLIAERVRRQEILYEPGRLIQIVVGETALRHYPGSAPVMRGQLDRLVSVAGLSSVDLRVVPLEGPLPILPVSGFSIEDDSAVYVESLTGELRAFEASEIAVYQQAFNELLAVTTEIDAIELIRRAMRSLGDG